MSVLNEGRVYGKLNSLESITTVPAYGTEGQASVYSDSIILPHTPEMSIGMTFSAVGSGTKSVKIEVEQSNDNTTFGVPTDIAAISSDWNGLGLLIKNITPDVTKYLRIKYTPLATPHDADLVVTANFNIFQV